MEPASMKTIWIMKTTKTTAQRICGKNNSLKPVELVKDLQSSTYRNWTSHFEMKFELILSHLSLSWVNKTLPSSIFALNLYHPVNKGMARCSSRLKLPYTEHGSRIICFWSLLQKWPQVALVIFQLINAEFRKHWRKNPNDFFFQFNIHQSDEFEQNSRSSNQKSVKSHAETFSINPEITLYIVYMKKKSIWSW